MIGEVEMGFGAVPSGSAETRGEGGIAEDGADGGSEGAIVARRDEQRGMLVGDGLFDAGSAESDDGEGHGLSFADGHVEGFGDAAGGDDAGRGEEGSATHQVADDAGGLGAEEGDVAGSDAGLGAERIEQGAVAHDEQLCRGIGMLDKGHGADEVRAAFDFDQAADEEKDGVARAGGERVGREEIEIDAGVEGAELACREAANEGALTEMVGDADEEAGSGKEFGTPAKVDASGSGAAEDRVGGRDVVSVEGDDEGNAEAALDGQSRGGVDGEVGVEECGTAALEGAEKIGGEAGLEKEAATEPGCEGVVASEEQRLFGIDGETGADETQARKEGRKAAQSVGLGRNESLRWRQELRAKDEDGGFHEEERRAAPRCGARARRELRLSCGGGAAT